MEASSNLRARFHRLTPSGIMPNMPESDDRLIAAKKRGDDVPEASLRPLRLEEMTGARAVVSAP